MPENRARRRLADLLRRFPLLIYAAMQVYRLFQPRYSIGVVGVVLNSDGEVLLVEHVFHPTNPWGLPGGWNGRNEHPASGVQRELQEELELEVDIGPLVLMDITYRGHLDMAYLCYPRSEIGKLNRELLDYGWFDSEQLPKTKAFHYRAIQEAIRRGQHQD